MAKTTQIQMSERVARAAILLAADKSTVIQRLQEEFGIGRTSAFTALREAKNAAVATYAHDRDAAIAEVLRQLNTLIGDERDMIKLRAIEAKAKLLGLNAPARVDARVQNIPPPPYDPQLTAAMADPEIRQAALQLEEAISSVTPPKGEESCER